MDDSNQQQKGIMTQRRAFVLKVDHLFTPEESHGIRYIIVSNGRIVDIVSQKPRGRIIDLTKGIVCPGFIDLGAYGFADHDLSEGKVEDLRAVASLLPSCGITSFLPSVSTTPDAPLLRLVHDGTPLLDTMAGARPLGFHVEGPFYQRSLSEPNDPSLIRLPTPDAVQKLLESGRIAMVTIAPELPGALEAIATLSTAGIVCSLGHTEASFDIAEKAYMLGARSITHLFNEMRPFHHRDPGIIGAAFVLPFYVQFIADGVHTDPEVIRMMHAIAGRLVIASTSIAATGSHLQNVRVAGRPITIDRTGALDHHGHLAGSLTPLNQAAANLVSMGQFSWEEAIRCVTSIPADTLHLADRGRIRPGARADITVIDRSFHILLTIGEGTTLYQSQKGLQ